MLLCSRIKPRGTLGVRGRNLQPRLISTSRDNKNDIQKFTVAVGSSGSITLDLYNSHALSSPASPIVIYLPPTGSHLQPTHPPIPRYLFSTSAALLAINYRWYLPPSSSPEDDTSSNSSLSSPSHPGRHPFPTPLHDTLNAYQFLLSTLLPRFSPSAPANEHTEQKRNYVCAPPRPQSPQTQRPILIYGSFLSGGLATSLALTESFASKSLPTRIAGLITRNAVLDWTEIVTSPPPFETSCPSPSAPSQRSSTGASAGEVEIAGGEEWQTQCWTSATLHALKTQLFTSPASGFDPFVSPTQFLRTGGLAVPRSWPDASPSPTTSSPPSASAYPTAKSEAKEKIQATSPIYEHDHDVELDPSTHLEAPELEPEASSPEAEPRLSDLPIDPPSRRAHLKFPPAASGLKIPPALLIHTAPPPRTSSPPALSVAREPTNSPSPSSSSSADTDTETPSPAPPGKKPARPRRRSPSAPQAQADDLAALLRRSVFTHELASRRVWDDELDAVAASEARVRVLGVADRDRERGGEGGEAVGGRGSGSGKGDGWGGEGEVVEGGGKGEIYSQRGGGGEGRDGVRGEGERAVREWIEDVLN